MQNKKLLVSVGIFIIIGAIIYYFYQDDIIDNGRVYASKASLCQQFAQSYLQTIQKTDNAMSSEDISSPENKRWEMAIDVETELYNLCLLDLNKDALKNYKPRALEKYNR